MALMPLAKRLPELRTLILSDNARDGHLPVGRAPRIGVHVSRALGEHCPKLQRIVCTAKIAMNDSAITALTGLRIPTADELAAAALTGKQHVWAATPLSALRSLNLSSCSYVGDSAMLALAARCPSLTSLSIAGAKYVSDIGVMTLVAHCRQLTNLSLRSVGGKRSAFHEIFMLACDEAFPPARTWKGSKTGASSCDVASSHALDTEFRVPFVAARAGFHVLYARPEYANALRIEALDEVLFFKPEQRAPLLLNSMLPHMMHAGGGDTSAIVYADDSSADGDRLSSRLHVCTQLVSDASLVAMSVHCANSLQELDVSKPPSSEESTAASAQPWSRGAARDDGSPFSVSALHPAGIETNPRRARMLPAQSNARTMRVRARVVYGLHKVGDARQRQGGGRDVDIGALHAATTLAGAPSRHLMSNVTEFAATSDVPAYAPVSSGGGGAAAQTLVQQASRHMPEATALVSPVITDTGLLQVILQAHQLCRLDVSHQELLTHASVTAVAACTPGLHTLLLTGCSPARITANHLAYISTMCPLTTFSARVFGLVPKTELLSVRALYAPQPDDATSMNETQATLASEWGSSTPPAWRAFTAAPSRPPSHLHTDTSVHMSLHRTSDASTRPGGVEASGWTMADAHLQPMRSIMSAGHGAEPASLVGTPVATNRRLSTTTSALSVVARATPKVLTPATLGGSLRAAEVTRAMSASMPCHTGSAEEHRTRVRSCIAASTASVSRRVSLVGMHATRDAATAAAQTGDSAAREASAVLCSPLPMTPSRGVNIGICRLRQEKAVVLGGAGWYASNRGAGSKVQLSYNRRPHILAHWLPITSLHTRLLQALAVRAPLGALDCGTQLVRRSHDARLAAVHPHEQACVDMLRMSRRGVWPLSTAVYMETDAEAEAAALACEHAVHEVEVLRHDDVRRKWLAGSHAAAMLAHSPEHIRARRSSFAFVDAVGLNAQLASTSGEADTAGYTHSGAELAVASSTALVQPTTAAVPPPLIAALEEKTGSATLQSYIPTQVHLRLARARARAAAPLLQHARTAGAAKEPFHAMPMGRDDSDCSARVASMAPDAATSSPLAEVRKAERVSRDAPGTSAALRSILHDTQTIVAGSVSFTNALPSALLQQADSIRHVFKRQLAVSHIQAVFRGWWLRTTLARIRFATLQAATACLHRASKAFLCRVRIVRAFARRHAAANSIITCFRAARLRELYPHLVVWHEHRVAMARRISMFGLRRLRWWTTKAHIFQQLIASLECMLHRARVAARRIQRSYREYVVRRTQCEATAQRIQHAARAWLAHRRIWRVRRRMCRAHEAATVIQALTRGALARSALLRLLWGTIHAQRVYRGVLARKRVARMRHHVLHDLRMKRAAMIIQRSWQARRACWAARQRLRMQRYLWHGKQRIDDILQFRLGLLNNGAATLVQRTWRTHCRRQRAARLVQAAWRMYTMRVHIYLPMRTHVLAAVIRIQHAFRSCLRRRYWHVLVAAAQAQDTARVRALQDAAASLIQSTWAAYRAQLERDAVCDAETFVQRRVMAAARASDALAREDAALHTLRTQLHKSHLSRVRAARQRAQEWAWLRRLLPTRVDAALFPLMLGGDPTDAHPDAAAVVHDDGEATVERAGMKRTILHQQRRAVRVDGIIDMVVTVGKEEALAFQRVQADARARGRPFFQRYPRDLSAPLSMSPASALGAQSSSAPASRPSSRSAGVGGGARAGSSSEGGSAGATGSGRSGALQPPGADRFTSLPAASTSPATPGAGAGAGVSTGPATPGEESVAWGRAQYEADQHRKVSADFMAHDRFVAAEMRRYDAMLQANCSRRPRFVYLWLKKDVRTRVVTDITLHTFGREIKNDSQREEVRRTAVRQGMFSHVCRKKQER